VSSVRVIRAYSPNLPSIVVDGLVRRFVHGPEDLVSTLGTPEHARLAAGLNADSFTGRDPTER